MIEKKVYTFAFGVQHFSQQLETLGQKEPIRPTTAVFDSPLLQNNNNVNGFRGIPSTIWLFLLLALVLVASVRPTPISSSSVLSSGILHRQDLRRSGPNPAQTG
jgi:hypothetical protein